MRGARARVPVCVCTCACVCVCVRVNAAKQPVSALVQFDNHTLLFVGAVQLARPILYDGLEIVRRGSVAGFAG